MASKPIFITETDYEQLKIMVESFRNVWNKDRLYLEQLCSELGRAHVLPSHLIGGNVVTMNSVVLIRDLCSGQRFQYRLVFPQYADLTQSKLSVLSPIGTALLGYQVGDKVCWRVPAGKRTFKIEKIVYQPELIGEHDF